MGKMSAILMTDIVGFTELSRKDKNLIRELGQKHRRVLKESVTRFQGRIINIFGDKSLALLGSPLDAVKCSIEIKQQANLVPVIPMRIALHVGEVSVEGDEVYGEAINLTSRMLKLAMEGSVLISDQLKFQIDPGEGIETRSAGICNLKYVDRPVEIFSLCQKGLVVPDSLLQEEKDAIQPHSIAVMPFLNLGSDRDEDYLGDGISEAIINALSEIEGVYVTARSSSFVFRNSDRDIRELGRILGVANILEGSFQKIGDRLRITAQLINTKTGFHIFSESYDKELLDLFSIQEEIAWLIARRLMDEISLKEKTGSALPRTSNIRALEYYLQARHMMARPAREDIRKAIKLLRLSVEADPDFVLPYAGISLCYIFMGALRFVEEEESYRKASEYSLRAIQIDPKLPEAMVVHALSSFWTSGWNLKNGDKVIGDALRIAPGSAEIRLFHGMFTLMSGNKEDALIEILLANKLDPLNPNILSRLGYAYLCLKEFEEAHTCFRLAHNTAPFAMYIKYILSWSYLLQEQYDKAGTALDEVDLKQDVYQSTFGTRGYLWAKQGRIEKAYDQIRLIGQMKEQGNMKFPHYNYALVYAGLNRADEMFYHLEKAFSEKPVHLMFIQSDPFWDGFRKDRRYLQMVNRVFLRRGVSETIIIHSDTRERLTLQTDQILYIEAEDNYSRFVWQEESARKEKVLRVTLGKVEDQLSGSDIIRCHRSYLVNCSKYSISGDSRGYRLTSEFDDLKVPVSRSRGKEILARYNQ